MKKAAFVSNTAYTLCLFRLGIMRSLRRSGYEITCIAPFDDRAEELMREGFGFIDLALDRKGRNPVKELRVLADLYKIYRREKFDVVSHYTIKPVLYGSVAAGLTKTRCVNTITGLGYVFIRDNYLCKFVKLLYRFALKFSDKVIFQNPDDLRLFLDNKLVRKEKTLTTPGEGVDIDWFSPQAARNSSKSVSFLFGGRFLWDKGLGELIEAFTRVRRSYPDSELGLLGRIDRGNPEGIPEETIRCWEKDGIVKHLGLANDVRPFIAKSDVIVYPSYREGLPRFLLEAMAMGKPIITTDAVGCREVTEDGKNGFMVKTKDAASLAGAMMRIAALPLDARLKMGQYGREKAAAEFNEKRILDTYLKIFEELSRPGSAAPVKPKAV